ncbi:hypothetical protein D3C72_2076120 [compost metagenome]
MVGMARKNENSVAALRDRPNSKPPMMVEPEREVPGIIARHWAQPIFRASLQRMSSTWSTRITCSRRSAQSMITPPTTRAAATVMGLNRYSWIRSANNTPRTTAGMKAINRLTVKRCASR